MANYYGSWRSNIFQVKDEEAFQTWAALVCETDVRGRKDGVCLLQDQQSDCGGLPSDRINPDTDDFEDINFLEELGEHLADGSVAIVMESGAEKLRYIVGQAYAIINVDGVVDIKAIDLGDIYKLAKDSWGIDPSRAEY